MHNWWLALGIFVGNKLKNLDVVSISPIKPSQGNNYINFVEHFLTIYMHDLTKIDKTENL